MIFLFLPITLFQYCVLTSRSLLKGQVLASGTACAQCTTTAANSRSSSGFLTICRKYSILQYCNAHNLKSSNSSVNVKFRFSVFCLHGCLQMSVYIGSAGLRVCYFAFQLFFKSLIIYLMT